MFKTNKPALISILIILGLKTLGQTIDVRYSSLIGSKDQLPFWIWANQLGKYETDNSSIQNLNLTINHLHAINNQDFTFETKANLDAIIANENKIRITELYAALNWRFLQLKTGAFAEKELYQGLSASNGNLAYSRNARPHPRIRAGFNQFVPLIKNTLSVYGFWEEGLLNDNRYVEGTRLHHKALQFRLGTPEKIEVTLGLEHYVMWAGTHPAYGKLRGWSDYFDYVTGSSGDEDALMTDQLNVAGNGYGIYQIGVSKAWENIEVIFYINHPFEDKSGMELENILDNLYGFFISRHQKNPLFKSFVLEYYHTLHQSGSEHLKILPDGSKKGRGIDNYYNHGIYRSGATYHQMAMASPLFSPMRYENGISTGFANTRFNGIHIGSNGYLSDNLTWKLLATYTNNKGVYGANSSTTYDPSIKQFSSSLQLIWSKDNLPLIFGGSLAFDRGGLYDSGKTTNRLGAMLSITWKIRE